MSAKDYNKIHENKLKELKQSLLGYDIYDQLELKSINNKKLDIIIDKMAKIVGKPVWKDFNFQAGKIFGIMRFILQNFTKRKELLDAIGLNDDYVDIYYKVSGNLPYVNSTDNSVNTGRPMDIEKTKEIIKIIGAKLNIVIDDDDLSDINEERWNRLYNAALERTKETVKFNKQNNMEINVPIVYIE